MPVRNEAAVLLDQLDILRQPSDLDLLVFFARHPRALLSSDHIAALVGYDANQIAASLERLLTAAFVTRTPHPRHVARMYLLVITPPGGGWLPALTRLATTRDGRLALLREIRRRSPDAPAPAQRDEHTETEPSAPLRFPRGRATADDSRPTRSLASPEVSSYPRKHGGRGGDR